MIDIEWIKRATTSEVAWNRHHRSHKRKVVSCGILCVECGVVLAHKVTRDGD